MRLRVGRSAALLVVLALSLALGACGWHTHLIAPIIVSPWPAVASPTGTVTRWAWALAHRDTAAYRSCLADDFVFEFAASDSAGNPYRDDTWGFAFENQAMGHLLAGGSDRPPATAVSIWIDNPLLALPDPRPERALPWHRELRTSVSFKITVNNNGTPDVTSVTGHALFYVVRGDSAVLSPARAAHGGSDSTRWYIQRWVDQTSGFGGASAFHPDPTHSYTIGSVKARYR